MFYHPAILNRQTGCFATIWLVATNGKKVSKREYLKVNVPRTCEDLMDYILVRVPPSRPGQPKPRLSLYLSSHLQYGVIKVYHHQCDTLLKDIRDVIKRLEKFRKVKPNIDMRSPDRGALCVPDALAFLEDNEWAVDPLFGQMTEADLSFLSPSTLGRMGGQFHSAWSSSTSSPGTQDSHTALPETITMKETPPVVMPITEFEGEDFPDDDIIDVLADAPDDAFVTEEGGDASTVPPPPPQSPTPVPAAAPSDTASPTAPRDPPAAAESQESSDDEDVQPPPRKKPKRKPKLVEDMVTQIPLQEIGEQLRDAFAHTAPPPMAGDIGAADPNPLFTRPVNVLPADLMPLWERIAVIPSYADLRAEERQESSGYSSSDRAASDEIAPPSDGAMSDVDGREQPSPSGQIRTAGSPGKRLEDIPEDVEIPGREDDSDMEIGEEEEQDRGAEFIRTFEDQGKTSMTLRSMLGDRLPGRKPMASAFMTLLVQVTARTLNAEQAEPYDDIWISLRPELRQE